MRQVIFFLLTATFLTACNPKVDTHPQEEEIDAGSEILHRETNHWLNLILTEMEEDSFSRPWYYASRDIDSTTAGIISHDTLKSGENIARHYMALIKKISSYSHQQYPKVFGNNPSIDFLADCGLDTIEQGLPYAFAKHKLLRLNYEMQQFLYKQHADITCVFGPSAIKNRDKPSVSVIRTSLDTTLLFAFWTSDPEGPHADFVISKESWYVVDYAGNADMPYTLIDKKLKIYYNNFIGEGEIISVDNDILTIRWKGDDEDTKYFKWRN